MIIDDSLTFDSIEETLKNQLPKNWQNPIV
jgi:hypothetical protein